MPPAPPQSRPARAFAAITATALVGVALVATAGYFAYREMTRPPEPPPETAADDVPADLDPVEDRFIRVGWQSEALATLDAFINANTVEERLKHVLRPDFIRERMEAFYSDPAIHDRHTPAEAFSAYILSEEDRRRGMFLMTYDQPPHFDIRGFFRPLAPIEVQYELEEPDILLSEVSRATNFSADPVRIHAFFKRTDDGLKLDWEIFAQTKFRTFRSFVDLPLPGASAVFRLLVIEDVPERGRAVSGTRTYRFADPANNLDSARINVPVDSEIGRILSVINWRGSQDTKPMVKNATVELKWSDDPEHPVLSVSRFICWEFLGLGGRPAPGTFEGY